MAETGRQDLKAKSVVLLCLTAFALVYGGYRTARSLVSPMQGFDFSQYYVTGRLILAGEPEQIYVTDEAYTQLAREVGVDRKFWEGGNAYPPIMAVLSAPLALLSYTAARTLFFALTIAAMIGAMPLLFASRSRERRREMTRLGWAISFIFWPTFFTLNHGQVNGLLFFFCVAGLFFARRDQAWRAGFFFGLAATIKLFPLIVLPFLILKKQTRVAGATGVCFLLLMVATLPFCGVDSYRVFVTQVLPRNFSAGGELTNQGFTGFFDKLLVVNGKVKSLADVPTVAHGLARIGAGATLLILLLSTRRERDRGSYRYELEFGLYFVAALLVLSKSYEHYGVFLLISYLVLSEFLIGFGGRRAGGLLFGVALSFCTWSFVMTWDFETPDNLMSHVGMNLLVSSKFLATLLLFGCAVGTLWIDRSKTVAVSPDR